MMIEVVAVVDEDDRRNKSNGKMEIMLNKVDIVRFVVVGSTSAAEYG